MARMKVDGNAQSPVHQLLNNRTGGADRGVMSGYLRTHAIGWAAGYHTTAPFTAIVLAGNDRPDDALLPSSILTTQGARIVTALASVGESIADKLPGMGSRLESGPLIARLVSGGLAGTILTYRSRQSPIVGALLGGTGAAFGSIAGYYSRQSLDKSTCIPDPVWGIVEDALALGLAVLAARS